MTGKMPVPLFNRLLAGNAGSSRRERLARDSGAGLELHPAVAWLWPVERADSPSARVMGEAPLASGGICGEWGTIVRASDGSWGRDGRPAVDGCGTDDSASAVVAVRSSDREGVPPVVGAIRHVWVADLGRGFESG
jgi:hypothetical protein